MNTNEQSTCRAEGCEKPASVRGHCIAHYYALSHMIKRSRGTENPITWETLEDAGVIPPKRKMGRPRKYTDFVPRVHETIAKQQDPTP